jgi:hypothetical protein
MNYSSIKCVLSVLLVCALGSTPRAAEPPGLAVSAPSAEQEYLHNSTIVVHAEILPALEIGVDVKLYQLLEDDFLLLQSGVGTQFDKQGRLAVDIGPGKDGWREGTLRVIVTPDGFEKQRQVIDVTVIRDSGGAGSPLAVPRSDVVVDLERTEDSFVVPAGHSFQVQGRLSLQPEMEVQAPAAIRLQLARRVEGDPADGLIVNEASLHCTCDENGNCTFRGTVTAPAAEGDYALRTYTPRVDALGQARSEPVERRIVFKAVKP